MEKNSEEDVIENRKKKGFNKTSRNISKRKFRTKERLLLKEVLLAQDVDGIEFDSKVNDIW